MPKAKTIKIYEKAGRPYKSDMELVVGAQAGNNEDFYEMWDKYKYLRIKEKSDFINWCKEHNVSWNTYQEYVDNWDSDAWEKFKNQMPGVRVEDLKKKGYTPDNWGIYIRLKGYFEIVNRSYSNQLMKRLINETEIKTIGRDKNGESSKNSTTNIDIAAMEDEGYENSPLKYCAQDVFNKAFKKMVGELDAGQRNILEAKQRGDSVSTICSDYNTNRKNVNAVLDYAKSRLSYWVEKVSTAENIGMSYKEMLEYLE